MTEKKITLGSAIDQIVVALEGLEEKSRPTAIHAACEFLNIRYDSTETPAKPGSAPLKDAGSDITHTKPHQSSEHSPAGRLIDIRKLKEDKNPKSARQMACVVAYYLQEMAPAEERKDTITAEDIEKYFKQAKFPLPGKIPQVLVDAKGAGYLDSPERGQYKLNAVGYNLVAHNLPSKSDA